jgi:hypothetical protein
MQIKSTNLFYRLAYLFKKRKPTKTDVCTIFWRCLGWALLFSAAVVGLIFAGIHWRSTLIALLAGAIAVLIVCIVGASMWGMEKASSSPPARLARACIADVKAKRCTIVEVTDGTRL